MQPYVVTRPRDFKLDREMIRQGRYKDAQSELLDKYGYRSFLTMSEDMENEEEDFDHYEDEEKLLKKERRRRRRTWMQRFWRTHRFDAPKRKTAGDVVS